MNYMNLGGQATLLGLPDANSTSKWQELLTHLPQYLNLQQQHCENLKSQTFIVEYGQY
jgi:Mlc titration factor MtfA (ptsG expression regulator)